MSIDMTDRIEHDTKRITILATDFDAAKERYTKKGWQLIRANRITITGATKDLETCVIEMRRPKQTG